MSGSQDFVPDPRNEGLSIYLNGELVQRADAKVSVFDGGFVVGDGVWEGIRLHNGALLFLDQHLDRLYWGAEKIGLNIGCDKAKLVEEINRLLRANSMTTDVHIRLMVTRGEKTGLNQDPRNALGKPTIVIVAEYKTPDPALQTRGLKLHTASIRCTPANMFDMRLNSHSRLNLISALLEAIDAGADEALMLDPAGFVSSCNATNFFFVKGGELCTSTGEFCFHGVTRANVINIAQENQIELRQDNFVLEDVYTADEAFVTGTFGGLTPVSSIDGHLISNVLPGPITTRLQKCYQALKDAQAQLLPNFNYE